MSSGSLARVPMCDCQSMCVVHAASRTAVSTRPTTRKVNMSTMCIAMCSSTSDIVTQTRCPLFHPTQLCCSLDATVQSVVTVTHSAVLPNDEISTHLLCITPSVLRSVWDMLTE